MEEDSSSYHNYNSSFKRSFKRSFCCCGNLEDEACGWPQKTVRALLALIVVTLGLGAEVAAALWLLHKNEISLSVSMIGLIAPEVTGVSAYYFGLSKGAAMKATDIRQENLEANLEKQTLDRHDRNLVGDFEMGHLKKEARERSQRTGRTGRTERGRKDQKDRKAEWV